MLVEWGDVVESTFGEHLVVRLDLVDGDVDARADHDRPDRPRTLGPRRWSGADSARVAAAPTCALARTGAADG